MYRSANDDRAGGKEGILTCSAKQAFVVSVICNELTRDRPRAGRFACNNNTCRIAAKLRRNSQVRNSQEDRLSIQRRVSQHTLAMFF